MTVTEQRIFVCEKLLEWKDCLAGNFNDIYGYNPVNCCREEIPPLTLDWLHECEKKLNDTQFSHYVNVLTRLAPGGSVRTIVSSTPEQRLAAFIETLGGMK